MAKLWTVESTGNLRAAKLVEYSDEEVARILEDAKKFAIFYDWVEEKDNWDDERGSGTRSGNGYYRISEYHVLVCQGKPVGVVFKMKSEGYGNFSASFSYGFTNSKYCFFIL